MNYLSIPAEITGEVPVASFGFEFGGRDDYALADWRNAGNLDAPGLMAAGSTSAQNYDELPAARCYPRNA